MYLIISHLSLYFFGYRFSHGSTRAISKNKEPPEIITVISTRDQLVTRFEKVYGELYTNKPKKLIKCW
jgi:hypothetical protein